mgnify:CR=1 FL=1
MTIPNILTIIRILLTPLLIWLLLIHRFNEALVVDRKSTRLNSSHRT